MEKYIKMKLKEEIFYREIGYCLGEQGFLKNIGYVETLHLVIITAIKIHKIK